MAIGMYITEHYRLVRLSAGMWVELVNYFAAALLMPYTQFKNAAESLAYEISHLSKTFAVSFGQICHHATSLVDNIGQARVFNQQDEQLYARLVLTVESILVNHAL